eukprot:s8401_g4.t1
MDRYLLLSSIPENDVWMLYETFLDSLRQCRLPTCFRFFAETCCHPSHFGRWMGRWAAYRLLKLAAACYEELHVIAFLGTGPQTVKASSTLSPCAAQPSIFLA